MARVVQAAVVEGGERALEQLPRGRYVAARELELPDAPPDAKR